MTVVITKMEDNGKLVMEVHFCDFFFSLMVYLKRVY